jgi:rhodanese-related sulfurtransferase
MPAFSSTEIAILIAAVLVAAACFLFRRRPRAAFGAEGLGQLVERGALVLDVRTPVEFSAGHARGSRNIPLDALGRRLGELDRSRPIIAVCASGARSSAAVRILRAAGFQDVHNAGPWQSLVNR